MIADTFTSLFIVGAMIGIYFLPTILAVHREVGSKWSVVVVNLFLGWTLIGWVVALAMSVRDTTPKHA